VKKNLKIDFGNSTQFYI